MKPSRNQLWQPLHLWGLLFALTLHAMVLVMLIVESQRSRGVPPKPRPIAVAIQLAPAAVQSTRAAAPPKPTPVAVPPPPKPVLPTPPPKPAEKPAPIVPPKPAPAAPKPPASAPPKLPQAEPIKAPTAEEIAIAGERGMMMHIRNRWLRPPRANPTLQCVVKVTIEPDGHIVSVSLVKSSGNADFDDSVVRAIYKSDPLPVNTPGAPKGPVITMTLGGDFLM